MTRDPAFRRDLAALVREQGLVYLDCGARGGRLPRAFRLLRNTEYVGFEADEQECARLNAAARPGHRFIPAVLAADSGAQTFHLTRSPACASLLEPDMAVLSSFEGLPDLFRVEARRPVETIALDECLAAHGIERADVLELDTQGSELDVLRGATAILARAILAVQTEVEFTPLYAGQPLFGEVDAFLQARRFQLFDLSRYYGRRRSLPPTTPTRGQLLWGHALYLRDPESLDDCQSVRLAVIAILLGIPDLAAELLDRAIASGAAAGHPSLERVRAALAGTHDSWPRRALRPLVERVRRIPFQPGTGRATWKD